MEKTLDDGTGVATMREWLDYITLLAAMSKDEAKRQLALLISSFPPPGEEAKGEELQLGRHPRQCQPLCQQRLARRRRRAGTLPPISGHPWPSLQLSRLPENEDRQPRFARHAPPQGPKGAYRRQEPRTRLIF